MRERRVVGRAWAVAVLLIAGTVVSGQVPDANAAPVYSPAAFTPLVPTRLVDTRIGLGAPQQRLQAGTAMDVRVAGELGIPTTATAVVANVTAVDASGPGYLQVLPTGNAVLGSTSTLNADVPGRTIPNATLTPLGDDGRLTIYATFTADVVIDISGYFTPVDAPTAAGRLVPLTPSRILDTRIALGHEAATVVTLQVGGRGGVPADGASAVVLNVTVDGPSGPGFVQVAPTPVERGASSNLNTSAGRTSVNLVVVPLGDGGAVDLFTTTRADLVADVVGYFTDSTATKAQRGLFVPIAPDRQLDSRVGAPGPLAAGTVVAIDVGDVSAGAIAVAGNLTATEATQAGYLQLAAPPIAIGASSSLNVAGAGQTVANAVVSPVDAGRLELFNQNPTHAILDVTGWFTSMPTVAFYEMNEAAGSTVLVDSSGNGLDGSIGRDIAAGTAVSGAIVHRFPYVAPDTPPTRPGHLDTVVHNSKLDPGTSDFAVTMRVRWTESFGNMIQKGQSDVGGGYFKWEVPDGRVRCVFRDARGTTRTATSSSALNDGNWHEIRCERTAQGVTMTVDGIVHEVAVGATGSISNTWPLSIAGKTSCNQVDVGCDYFVGDIDWIRIDKG